MSRIKKENDTVIVRIFCALFILGFFAFAAGGPLVLSIIGYQHEVWLLHGMNYQPDIMFAAMSEWEKMV